MRVIGIFEDEDGESLYLIEREDVSGGKILILYDEGSSAAKILGAAGAWEIFEEGVFERCSMPAPEVFFPEELEKLAKIFVCQSKEEEK